jgi:hypothetical protein
MLNRQRINAVDAELRRIDREIVDLAADGYMVDVNRLLDRRLVQQARRDALQLGVVPNG